jgi:hypothetical protein
MVVVVSKWTWDSVEAMAIEENGENEELTMDSVLVIDYALKFEPRKEL